MNIYIGEPVVVSDMQGPCPDGFHVPTSTEWESVKTIWTSLGGGGSDGTGFSTILKLPLSGAIEWNSGNISAQGSYGYYWSSSPYGSSKPTYSLYLLIGASYILPTYDNPRSSGHSIRPFKNSSVIPTSSWTKLYGTSIESGGIFWNSIKGLISLSSNGSTWVTIADKNLGATTVWESGNTLSQNNCGYYYQRGNNYGFPFTGATSTSSTKVNAQNYGPGNYYSGSTFIKGNNDWSSVQNDNLRGGETGVKPGEVKNIYIGEKPYEGPLRFTANTAGSTISLNKTGSPTSVTLETSTDGSTWSTYTFGTTITLTNIGDKVSFRNTSTSDTGFNLGASNKYQFVMTGSISAEGDTNYLLNKNSTTTVSDYCFYQLFHSCTSLTTAPQLPATTLGNYCYSTMFFNCQNLTTATSLPATTLKQYCYTSMFNNCINLEQIPALPATTLTVNCYNSMFSSCQKIKLSASQTGEYQTPYRIPTEGTGTTSTNSLNSMFSSTGGSFTGTPSINTTYYTSNTVV